MKIAILAVFAPKEHYELIHQRFVRNLQNWDISCKHGKQKQNRAILYKFLCEGKIVKNWKSPTLLASLQRSQVIWILKSSWRMCKYEGTLANTVKLWPNRAILYNFKPEGKSVKIWESRALLSSLPESDMSSILERLVGSFQIWDHSCKHGKSRAKSGIFVQLWM